MVVLAEKGAPEERYEEVEEETPSEGDRGGRALWEKRPANQNSGSKSKGNPSCIQETEEYKA